MPDFDAALSDGSASDWLKAALSWALRRHRVDTADAEYLASLLGVQCDV